MIDEQTKRKILIEYGAGASISALSKKFTLSRPTISKILSDGKSLQKVYRSKKKVDSLPEREKAVVERIIEEEEESNKALAEKTVRAIMKSLPKDIAGASLKDKMRVLEQMTAIFGIGDDDDDDKVGEIIISAVDGSGDDEEP